VWKQGWRPANPVEGGFGCRSFLVYGCGSLFVNTIGR
jgi:hypothetical protein